MPVLKRARGLRADARAMTELAKMQKKPDHASSLSRYADSLEQQAEALERDLALMQSEGSMGPSRPIRYWLQFVTPAGEAYFPKTSRYFSRLEMATREGIIRLQKMRAAHPEISRFEVVEIVSRKIAAGSENLGSALVP